jgi:thiamine biosynthesis lipoprotein ApbE
METKKLFKGWIVVILSLFFMACGNNEAAKTERGNSNQENMVSTPADSTTIKKDMDAAKDTTTARKEKEEDEEKENGKDKDD